MSVITKISETFWVNRSPTLTSKASDEMQPWVNQLVEFLQSFSSFGGFSILPFIGHSQQNPLVFSQTESARKIAAIGQESMCPFDTAKWATFRPSASLGFELNQVEKLVDVVFLFSFEDDAFFKSVNVDLPHGVGGVMGEDFSIVETTIWIWHTYFGLYKLYPFPVVNSTNNTTPWNHSAFSSWYQ